MSSYTETRISKTPRIERLVTELFALPPQIEADRAVLLTEAYRATENEPIITRRAKAFAHILENLPVTIRPDELIVGTASRRPRSSQTFPEYSFEWLEQEFDTLATRSADPFYISEETKAALKEVHRYWKGKTTSDLALSAMCPEAVTAIEHSIFTPGNYLYNGIGHVTVGYDRVLAEGFAGIERSALQALEALDRTESDYPARSHFLEAVVTCCRAAVTFAHRYAEEARRQAEACTDAARREELRRIAENCARVPENGAQSFYEACQSFWFVQLLLQIESNGHSISPGRFDQYMYPYFAADLQAGKITRETAQEYIDCVWVKLNDLNKCRDAASAEGFAGYSMFQNLVVGGQDADGNDATNDLSFMCIQASDNVGLPQPSLSIRVWNGSPQDLMMRAAALTRTGIGLPAYYNDEVIIPALINRGLTLRDARQYNLIGCVEPQKSGKTDGWHDAAFYNMCRPMELVFSNGVDDGVQIGPRTGTLDKFTTFEEFYDAYKKQSDYAVSLMVNADNAIDMAHAERCPLPFESSMVDDCIARGRSMQEGGAVYNFTGPQGFGVANMADGLFAVRRLVYETRRFTLEDFRDAMQHNFAQPLDAHLAEHLTAKALTPVVAAGKAVSAEDVREVYTRIQRNDLSDAASAKRYAELLAAIEELPRYGNDDPEVDALAKDVAYTYTRPLQKFRNPRGGRYQAGLYPVSANVPLGAQTGATPDGRLAGTPIADGVSPAAGRDTHGPTAAANSVSRLDHYIASNGTLYNMKFHPSALAGQHGLENFVSLIRSFFDQKGSHVQFNVVSKETLLDAQKHPEKYKSLVVRVAGYSALFTSLSRSLQDDIIHRTEQGYIG